MSCAPRSPGAEGFTLIEVLLAVAITAFVMTTVAMTFRITLEGREVVENLGESTESGPRIINLIERDLRGLWTFNVKGNAVLRGRSMDVASFEADRLDLITTTDSVGYVLDLQNRQHRTTLCEVGYWLKQNPRYRDLMELWRREDPMVDGDLLTQGSFQLVHDRIKSFKLTFYRTLGYESEELLEWDSSADDELPRRIKLEFTLERKRGSRNVVSDAEVGDFEGAEKTYVRHFVLDARYGDVLRSGTAMIPIRPPRPEVPEGPSGAGGPTAPKGGAGPRTPGGPDGSAAGVAGQFSGQVPGGNARPGGQQGGRGSIPGTPLNLGDLLRGGNRGGGFNPFGGGSGR